ncbi:uncharacterized protein LOC108143765 [Drosophila elegans]|uniref:uncharacterized protein LOC108143765 n=1 Tax=Drosophila elegans TaxID=30023 RepID=UPI0007E863FA|nr:uncharacterized protein LOC108143765 [Drosophila elegans]
MEVHVPGDTKNGVAQRTWRRILEHLAPIKGCQAIPREISWYRGLSQSQLEAANSLCNMLRDNMDEMAASGLAKILVRLGLHPTPPVKTLHLVMHLSRGNDLAFLWFLMEMCYKTPHHGQTYSVNEQIIMSSIFRLDLLPTLRELDRWLPLPHASQMDRDKAERLRQSQKLKKKRDVELERQKELAKKEKIMTPLSPYFQEQNIAGLLRNECRLLSDFPANSASLLEMEEEPPESNLWSRWFGSYKLSESHRIGKGIIFEEINSIFESFRRASLPPRDVESLCAHHQYIREMEKSLKAQLEAIKQRKCEELITVRNRLEERKRKRVVQELEEMSACYLKRFQDMADRARLASTRKQLFGGTSASALTFGCPAMEHKCDDFEEERCQTFEADRPPERPPIKRPKRRSRSGSRSRLSSGAEAKPKSMKKSRPRSRSSSRNRAKRKANRLSDKKSLEETVVKQVPPRKGRNEFPDIMVKLLKGNRPILPGCPDFRPESTKCAKCQIYNPQEGLPWNRTPKQRPSSLMQFLQLCGTGQAEQKDSDPGQQDTNPSSQPDRKESVQLLELGPPGCNCVKFNYRELFGSLQRTHLDDERMRLKEAFVRAIDDDVQYLSAALNGGEEGSLDALVDRAAKRVFAKDVKTFHKELERLQRKKAAGEKDRRTSRLNFGQDFYDPENLPLMKEMLRLGLEKVAKDKRYVLPTLPHVHCVPYLIEWIRLRYGKRYSYREKENMLVKDMVVMDQLAWMMRTDLVNIPSLPVGGNVRDLAKLRKYAKCHRELHTNRFLEAIMEVERVFFSAMKPQLSNAATESTFLAYLPAHFNDLAFTVNNANVPMGISH